MNRADQRRSVVAAGVLITMLLAWSPRAHALDPSLHISQYAHTSWKVRDGVFRGAINAVTQTPDGYLWLGTDFGLVRFDGVAAVPWQPPSHAYLAGHPVIRLLTTRDGTLWIGTDLGLTSQKAGKLTQYPELANQRVSVLVEDREGTVWAGSAGTPYGRLCAIQNGAARCYGEDGTLAHAIAGMYEDRRGNLWVGVPNGLWRWKPGRPHFYPIPDHPSGVRPLGEDGDGTLLITWQRRIARFANGRVEPSSTAAGLPDDYAWRFRDDRDGVRWIAMLSRGLARVHRGRTELLTESTGLSGDAVRDVFEDREGNIWVATLGGLDRFHDLAVSTLTQKQGLRTPTMWSVLAARDGSVWLGSGLGLGRWRSGQLERFGPQGGLLNGLGPGSLLEDHRGRIWASTSREFGYLAGDRFVPIRGVPAGFVFSIVEDAARDIWIMNYQRGVLRLRGEAVQEFSWAALGRTDHVTSAVADPERGIWLGFEQGDVSHFSEGRVGVVYSARDGLGAGQVLHLRFDSSRALWAATKGGLTRIKGASLTTLSSKNGLPCDTVHWSIEDDARSLWVYTACGLLRISPAALEAWLAVVENDKQTKHPIEVTVFDLSDGVRSSPAFHPHRPRVTKTADGRIWFLPIDGVSVVDPLRLGRNELPPPVYVERIIADHTTYDVVQGLRLPPLVRDLQIYYTALSFVAPEKVRFRYMLEGQDPDWKEVINDRQVQYSNLGPGHYRFRVMACNNSGVWNEAGAFLDFSIAPTIYQRTPFRVLVGAVLLALLFAGYRVRVQRVRRQEQKLRSVIETIPVMTWTALPDGSVDFINRQGLEYTGLTVEQLAGSGWQTIIHPEDLERHLEKRRASLETGQPFESEVRYRSGADGQYRWFLARIVPLHDGRGKILKWYGTSTDIEERERSRQLESELAHINRVSMLGELTASLAHEINQPITGTITSADACMRWLTRDQPDLEEARANIKRIKQDGQRAAEIINRLRSFYKKDTATHREPVDVNEVVSEMLVLLRSEANRYSIVMQTELAAGLPKVRADRVQLQQVLMNLMLNGIEAMSGTDGNGELTIRSWREDGQVLVSVSDTGVGLPADKLDQIFLSFFTTKSSGTGMGLSISRTIIESHGGRLWAENNSNGRGAKFQFTLPIKAHDLDEVHSTIIH